MLDKTNIIYHTDWNRECLLGNENIVVRWLTVYNKNDGKTIDVDFKFSAQGDLESIDAG